MYPHVCGGFPYQWSTNPLKPVFTRELLLAELTEQIRDRRYEWGMSRVQAGGTSRCFRQRDSFLGTGFNTPH